MAVLVVCAVTALIAVGVAYAAVMVADFRDHYPEEDL
jgi:hypothetical protein